MPLGIDFPFSQIVNHIIHFPFLFKKFPIITTLCSMLRGGGGVTPCTGVVFGRSAISSLMRHFRQVAPVRGIVRNIFAVSKCLRARVPGTTFYSVTISYK